MARSLSQPPSTPGPLGYSSYPLSGLHLGFFTGMFCTTLGLMTAKNNVHTLEGIAWGGGGKIPPCIPQQMKPCLPAIILAADGAV